MQVLALQPSCSSLAPLSRSAELAMPLCTPKLAASRTAASPLPSPNQSELVTREQLVLQHSTVALRPGHLKPPNSLCSDPSSASCRRRRAGRAAGERNAAENPSQVQAWCSPKRCRLCHGLQPKGPWKTPPAFAASDIHVASPWQKGIRLPKRRRAQRQTRRH